MTTGSQYEEDMNFNSLIPQVNPSELQYMRQTDLKNYYRNVRERELIHCQICKSNIVKNSVFEHTMSTRHKYNKLLFGIAQGRSHNLDVDFIVLNIDRLQCRYCDSVIINSDKNDLVIDHIRDSIHIRRRQNYLDRVGIASNSDIEYNLLKSLDSLINYTKEIEKQTNQPTQKITLSEDLVDETKQIKNEGQINQISFLNRPIVPNNEQMQSGIELLGCIRVGEDGTGICTVCHVIVPNNSHCMDVHVNGKKHKNKIKNETELPDSIIVRAGTCSCMLCLVEFPESQSCINDHVNSKKHKKATLQSMQSKSEIVEIKDAMQSTGEPEPEVLLLAPKRTIKPMPESVQVLNCKMGNIMPNLEAINDIDQHSVSQCSAVSDNEILQSEKELPDCLILAENGAYMCVPCRIEVSKIDIHQHVCDKKHKRKLKKINRSERHKLELQETETSKLEVKDVVQGSGELKAVGLPLTPKDTNKPMPERVQVLDFPTTEEIMITVKATNNIDQHSLPQCSTAPNDKDSQIGMALPNCFSIGENGAYMCTPCCTQVPRTSINITEHINGKKHKQKVIKMNESEFQKSKLQETRILSPVSVTPDKMPALPNTVKTSTYMCITCLISVPNDKVSIKEHNECQMHKKKKQELKIDVQNAVYLNGRNSSNYVCLLDNHIVCKLCKLFLPEHSLITDHVDSKEHKDNIPQTPEPSSSNNIRDLDTGVSSKYVDNGLVHIVAIDDVWACKICRKVITSLADVHVRTKKHQAKMEKVDERLIGYEEVENLWVCKVCNKIFPKSKEFTHIFSFKHIRKTEELS